MVGGKPLHILNPLLIRGNMFMNTCLKSFVSRCVEARFLH